MIPITPIILSIINNTPNAVIPGAPYVRKEEKYNRGDKSANKDPYSELRWFKYLANYNGSKNYFSDIIKKFGHPSFTSLHFFNIDGCQPLAVSR